MNITEAKQIRLVDYLSSLGHHAVKVRKNDHWYLSPLRNEYTPSFKVNDYTNEWYDFGLSQGGDILDLVKPLFNMASVSDALRYLDTGSPIPSSMKVLKRTVVHESIKEKMKDVEIVPLKHPALLSYLASRGIDTEIGRMYCREIHYNIIGKATLRLHFRINQMVTK